MSLRSTKTLLLLLLSGSLGLLLHADPAPLPAAAPETPAAAESGGKSSAVVHPLHPGPYDGYIATATAAMLQRFHYSKQTFNAALSSKFFDRYLELLDPQRLHFLQSDLAEFEPYRTNLDRLTLPERRRVGDTRPAYDIFNRFVERLQQRVDYTDDLLKHEKFTFNTDERVVLNRKESPYPKDLTEAKQLWRDRLRAEYLQEKLGKNDPKKKGAGASGTDAASPEPKALSWKAPDKKPKKSDAEEIVDTLSHRYHRILHSFIDWDSDDVLQYYLTALTHVYDPHSDYFGKSTLDSFAIQMNLSLYGIGAELMSEDGFCTINKLLPGGPATLSKKLKEKDRIIAVAQSNQPPVDVVDMSLNKAVQLIRGPKGTEVRLTVIPAGADAASKKVVTLIRDKIQLEEQAAKAKLIEMASENGRPLRLGVIDLPSFYAPFDPSNSRNDEGPKSSTSEDVAKLLTKLKQENVAGVVLDLRHNGGGSLEEAIRLTGLFIKEGPVVQVHGADDSVQEDRDPDPSVLYDGPLIVLTSRLSASASEILAGALQDYGRALIVGDTSTHGKGTVQSVQQLPRLRGMTNDPGALKVTIKKFYRPSGVSTQKIGVRSDIVLPSIFDAAKDIGESSLENAMEAGDPLEPAKFDYLNLVKPYLEQLRKLSTERIATDKDFAYLLEDIEQFKKQQADKTISLDEKQRLKEKAEADARQKARDKERLARAEPKEKVYELSLKQAVLPGLPAPLTRTNLVTAGISTQKAHTMAALSTNGPLAAVKGVTPEINLEDETDETKPPPIDQTMVETEHILADYVSLLHKANLATAARP